MFEQVFNSIKIQNYSFVFLCIHPAHKTLMDLGHFVHNHSENKFYNNKFSIVQGYYTFIFTIIEKYLNVRPRYLVNLMFENYIFLLVILNFYKMCIFYCKIIVQIFFY